MRFLFNIFYILTEIVYTIFNWIYAFCYIFTRKIFDFSFWYWFVMMTVLILLLLLSLLQSRRGPIFYRRYHSKKTFCLSMILMFLMFFFYSCFLLGYPIISLFLKLNLFRCNRLLVGDWVFACVIVGLVFRDISTLWKLILKVKIHFTFCVGVMVKRFINSILKIELLFTLEKIKDCLIISNSVPV